MIAILLKWRKECLFWALYNLQSHWGFQSMQNVASKLSFAIVLNYQDYIYISPSSSIWPKPNKTNYKIKSYSKAQKVLTQEEDYRRSLVVWNKNKAMTYDRVCVFIGLYNGWKAENTQLSWRRSRNMNFS